MPYAYVATADQVDALNTQALVAKPNNAIWCPPPNLIPWHVLVEPEDNDEIWLLWRRNPAAVSVLLGAGNLIVGPPARYGTNVLWTDTDMPGLRPVAQALGYGGGLGMSFLSLRNVHLVDQGGGGFSQVHVHIHQNGLNQLAETEEQDLRALLNI